MSFPIHDRFGEIDPIQRKIHLRESVTPESLIEHTKGKTLEQLQFEGGPANPINLIPSDELGIGLPEGEISESEKGLGPKGHRYIQDPSDSGSVIDMRHFIEAARIGFIGEYLGAGVEIQQGLDKQKSAWEREDYKSNFLGVVFRNNYYDPDEDISQQFNQFFTDLKNDDLKGFVPAVEYLIQDGIDLAKDAKRALQQLGGRIEQQIEKIDNSIEQLGNSPESQQLKNRLRNVLDKLVSSIAPAAYAGEVQDNFNLAGTQSSPLVLDLDGDGIELTAKEDWLVRFDIDGDGFREATGWVKSDDGLLVFDRNNDGYINDKSELFGNNSSYSNGFEALKIFDTDKNNIINANDTNFSKLQVWRDLDGDGYSDVQELFTLAELGIQSIKTTYSNVNILNAGNSIKQTSSFVMNGQEKTIVDAWFTIDQFNSYYDPISTFNQPIVITQEILKLPNLKGYGNLPDLRIAIAKDAQLLSLVKSFSSKTTQGDISGASELIRPILFRWAGVDGIIPTSRYVNVNAQELGFLEKFVGTNFNAVNPGPNQGSTLTQTYANLASALTTRLFTQTSQLSIAYNVSSDTLTFADGTATDALNKFQQLIGEPTLSAQLNLEVTVLASYLREQGKLDGNLRLGTIGADTLVGSANADYLFGFNGNDSLSADLGNDSLNGGDGDDTINAGSGNDSLNGGLGNDLLLAGDGDDNLNGGIGNDLLDGGSGNDTLIGTEGTDTVYGGLGNDTYSFAKGHGNDTLQDIYLVNGVTYDAGSSDTLEFGTGITRSDLNWNFNGTDLTFSFASTATDKVTIQNMYDAKYRIENFKVEGLALTLSEVMTKQVWKDEAARNVLNWTNSAISFDGLAGNDSITTGTYADQLFGGDGLDTINAGAGNDTLDGGLGNDSLNGDYGNDSLNGGDGDDSLNGGSNNDTLNGDSGNDSLLGGSEADSLIGGIGNDFLDGGLGNDSLNGGVGNDTIYGGQGDDTYYFEKGHGMDTLQDVYLNGTTIYDGGTNDTLEFGTGITRSDLNWNFNGTDLTFSFASTATDKVVIQNMYDAKYRIENFKVEGLALTLSEVMTKQVWKDEAARNVLSWTNSAISFDGLAGNDSITTGNYADQLFGGDGLDTINSGYGNDTLDGGLGNDSLNGDYGNDSLNGGDGDDSLNGGINNDTLNGGLGNDSLLGGSEADSLIGEVGNDFLNGGEGSDSLTGGEGSDRFIYDRGIAIFSSSLGIDRITDFVSGTDKIVLDKTTFAALTSIVGSGFNISKEFAVVGSDVAASTAEALIVFSSETGNLFYNQNGVTSGFGSGAQFASLSGITTLSVSDFELQA